MENDEITQPEIDKLGINSKISEADDLRNIIILMKNEILILEKELDEYPIKKINEIKKKLSEFLKKIITIRKF